MSRVSSPPTTITISLLRPLISSKDKEENLVAGKKNPLPQLWRLRDRAIFGMLVMESGMPKTLLPFDHDKEANSICVDLVWNKFRSNSAKTHQSFRTLLVFLTRKLQPATATTQCHRRSRRNGQAGLSSRRPGHPVYKGVRGQGNGDQWVC